MTSYESSLDTRNFANSLNNRPGQARTYPSSLTPTAPATAWPGEPFGGEHCHTPPPNVTPIA